MKGEKAQTQSGLFSDGDLGRGLWGKPEVPKTGWICAGMEDLGEPALICGMCLSSTVRYVHYMSHAEYNTGHLVAAGCICAGYMSQDSAGAEIREQKLKSSAGKRLRWLTRKWKVSKKGNDYLKFQGWLVTIYPRFKDELGQQIWGFRLMGLSGESSMSNCLYTTKDSAKLAAFDQLCFMEKEG